MLTFLTQKNVTYKGGVPKNLLNVERVTHMTLISTLYSDANWVLTTGAMSVVNPLDLSTRIAQWSTRYQLIWKQYLIKKLTVVINIMKLNYTTTPIGKALFVIQENADAPASTILNSERGEIDLANFQDNEKNSCHIIWVPKSSEDFQWRETTTSTPPCYLKGYALVGGTFTDTGDSLTRFAYTVYYDVAFRYLGV